MKLNKTNVYQNEIVISNYCTIIEKSEGQVCESLKCLE